MLCKNCEKEFENAAGDCPHCGAVPELETEVLDRRERDGFSGITIDESGDGREEEARFGRQEGSGVYVKQVNFSSGILSQIAFFLIMAFAIFFLLPTFLLFFIIISAVWFVFKLFR